MSIDIVGGVGRTEVTDGSNKEEAIIANTSLIFVDFISSADGILGIELMAYSIIHVVAQNTNTLAQNIVVDLIDWTINNCRFRIGYWGNVSAICNKGISIGFGSVSEVVGCFSSSSYNVLVGLRANGKGGCSSRPGLGMERDEQEGNQDSLD